MSSHTPLSSFRGLFAVIVCEWPQTRTWVTSGPDHVLKQRLGKGWSVHSITCFYLAKLAASNLHGWCQTLTLKGRARCCVSSFFSHFQELAVVWRWQRFVDCPLGADHVLSVVKFILSFMIRIVTGPVFYKYTVKLTLLQVIFYI